VVVYQEIRALSERLRTVCCITVWVLTWQLSITVLLD